MKDIFPISPSAQYSLKDTSYQVKVHSVVIDNEHPLKQDNKLDEDQKARQKSAN